MLVVADDKNYNRIPTGNVEMDFDAFVEMYNLEVKSLNGYGAIVSAKWRNGNGFDTYDVTFSQDEE